MKINNLGISELKLVLKTFGWSGIITMVSKKIGLPFKNAKCTSMLRKMIAGKNGLELGGPSNLFLLNGQLPIYSIVGNLDNVNFSHSTVWEGEIETGDTFRFDPKKCPGHQYVGEASELMFIDSEKYEFLLASHILEHCANPIRTLSEWKRVVRRDGILVVVVPDKRRTFDRNRPTTTIEHLRSDFQHAVLESDETHLDEILRLHDLSRDPGIASFADFKERSQRNFENRCLHHHVFDSELLSLVSRECGLSLISCETLFPYHIICLFKKE